MNEITNTTTSILSSPNLALNDKGDFIFLVAGLFCVVVFHLFLVIVCLYFLKMHHKALPAMEDNSQEVFVISLNNESSGRAYHECIRFSMSEMHLHSAGINRSNIVSSEPCEEEESVPVHTPSTTDLLKKCTDDLAQRTSFSRLICDSNPQYTHPDITRDKEQPKKSSK